MISKIIVLIFLTLVFQLIKSSIGGVEYLEFKKRCSEIEDSQMYHPSMLYNTTDPLVFIDLNLLCKLSLRDSRSVNPGLNGFMSKILNLSNIPCNQFNFIVADFDSFYLDTKYNLPVDDIERSDLIRSKALSCNKEYFDLNFAEYTHYDEILVRNTLDFYLGFIKQEETYYKTLTQSTTITENLAVYYMIFGYKAEYFRVSDYRTPDKPVESKIHARGKVGNVSSLESDDYLLETVNDMRSRYLELECKDVEELEDLIEEIGLLITNVKIKANLTNGTEFSRLKYDIMYGPNRHFNTEEILTWIGLNSNDFTTKSLSIQKELGDNEGENNNYEISDYISLISNLISLMNDISNSYTPFFNMYYSRMRQERLSTRCCEDPKAFSKYLDGETIC